MFDELSRAWYGDRIELALRKKSEQEYEDLFNRIMQAIHSEDFLPVKAAGSEGDWKSDGYLAPDNHVFQSYAPSSGFEKRKLIGKIDSDLPGAVEKWGDKMGEWTFVHNDWEGLPSYAIGHLENYKHEYPHLMIHVMGPAVIKDKALSLPKHKLVDLFGVAPTMTDMRALSHKPVKTLLNAIKRKQLTPGSAIAPVAVDKLEYNKLSSDIEILLRAGRTKEKLVEELLLGWPDPQYGEDLAESFRDKYIGLKESGMSANDIFDELKVFAGGSSHSAEEQVSALAVLSYFFSRCDIFENVPIGISL
ncbi:ABC-three component system protein [Sedimenticola hydrogenitrophicus]|uniref:ABC-three component system protein n=1 Tax=Sedimenticola hydrogenitrophicus TaxID=2967975 RepID=UPI0023AFD802|nr:ABC-three component system protein [Sedimenticola hydrogenitrophicus]